jgi:hypothetical protein
VNSTELPPSARLLAAILFVAMWIRGYTKPVPPGIPFLDVPALLLDEDILRPLLKGLVYSGMILFALGWSPRVGCLIAGLSLVVQTLLGMEYFSNGRLFAGLLLMLIGLYRNERGLFFLRAQVLLLYLGAVLSKAIDPDWWNGRALTAVMRFHPSSAAWANETWFTMSGGWLTIAAEASIFMFLLIPATRWVACLLCLGFHTALAVILTEDFGVFYYAVAGSILLFLDLPTPTSARLPRWLAVASRYGLFDGMRTEQASTGPARFQTPDRVFVGCEAIWVAVAFSPIGLLVPVALANMLSVQGAFTLRSASLILFACFLGGAIVLTLGPRRLRRVRTAYSSRAS